MATICPACKTENPESNRYCQNCGAALPVPVAAAVSGSAAVLTEPAARPAPVSPPSVAAPAELARPPAVAPPPPGSRLSLPIIAGAVAGVMIIVALVVLLLLRGGGGGGNNGGGGDGGGGSTTGSVVENSTLSIRVPDSWEVVANKPNYLMLTPKQGSGLLGFISLKDEQAQTPDHLVQGELAFDQKDHPDAAYCQVSKPHIVPGGAGNGVMGWICYTYTPSQGQAYPVVDAWIAGVGADGHTVYEVNIYAPKADFNAFVNDAVAIANGVHWKLSP